MTTYNAIAATRTDPNAPIDSALMKDLAGNPLAIAEGDSTAPVNQAFWHPYNKVTVGDANDGKIYDFAVNGLVASIETPVFDAGYDYRLRWNSIRHNNGAVADFRLELRRQTSATYNPAGALAGSISNAVFSSGHITMEGVGIANHNLWGFPMTNAGVTGVNATLVGTATLYRVELAVSQRLDRARLTFSAGSITNGVVYLDRKRAIP
jgi:hypothetical protein